MGAVGRVDASNGSIETNIWNYFQLPNLGNGNVWVGNATGFPTETVAYGNANVAAYLPTYTGNLAGSRLDITSGSNVWTIGGNTITSPTGGQWRADTVNNDDYITSAADGYIDLQSLYANSAIASQIHLEHGYAHITTNNGTTKQWNFYGNGNFTAPGDVIAVGNISGSYILGNGSQLTGLPAGYTDQDVANVLASFGSNSISTTGNVTATNIFANGISNTAGNLAIGNLLLTTSNAWTNSNILWNPNTNPAGGQIRFGDGNAGVWTSSTDPSNNASRSFIWTQQRIIPADNGSRKTLRADQGWFDLNGATNYGGSNTNSRIQTTATECYVVNGTITNTNPNIVRGHAIAVFAGTGSTVGNVGAYAGQSIYNQSITGSTVTNSVNQLLGTVHNGTVQTHIGVAPAFASGSSSSIGNVFVLYNASSSSTYGFNNANSVRASAKYYFIYNDDDVAQVQLGSLRSFHEYRQDETISSGAVTIDANAGQVQYIDVTEDITSVTFSNFVVSASDSVNTDYQTDTVTVIFRQDGTGRSITLPTGAGYRYAGGISAMGSTADAVQMISVTAIYDAAAADTEYLITVSPEFV